MKTDVRKIHEPLCSYYCMTVRDFFAIIYKKVQRQTKKYEIINRAC